MQSRSSSTVIERSKLGLVRSRSSMPYLQKGGSPQSDRSTHVDFDGITQYFIEFWSAPHVALAINTLERLESKMMLKPLHKKYGQWCPPPELAHALETHTHSSQSRPRSHLPDTKDARNLQFVLKMLGCSLHESRPYTQFLKAKTVRQKRLWVYKYMTPKEQFEQANDYTEPICPTRLKRLYQFFPDRFKEQNDLIYFNNKLVTYDESKRVFYFGVTPTPSSDESD